MLSSRLAVTHSSDRNSDPRDLLKQASNKQLMLDSDRRAAYKTAFTVEALAW